MKIFIAVVLLLVVIYIWRRQKRGRDEFLESEAADQEKNHVLFAADITSDIADKMKFSDKAANDGHLLDMTSSVKGYYLPDEDIIRIHKCDNDDPIRTHQVEEKPASSEEDAENKFDEFVEEVTIEAEQHHKDVAANMGFDPNKYDLETSEIMIRGETYRSIRERFDDGNVSFFNSEIDLHGLYCPADGEVGIGGTAIDNERSVKVSNEDEAEKAYWDVVSELQHED